MMLRPPIEPMLAKAVTGVPNEDALTGGVSYEPKWDGFRVLIFRDADAVIIQGRGGDDLAYAFPEAAATASRLLPAGTVIDGELVIVTDGRLQFEQLSQRIRPRSEAGGWKIAELSEQFPTSFIAFDVLEVDGLSLVDAPYSQRRAELLRLSHSWNDTDWFVTPATRSQDEASRWFDQFEGAGLDGIVAKGLDSVYTPGARSMLKIKHARTADVVVGGWRAYTKPGPDGQPIVGSLLLGLYDHAGRFHQVGSAASFTMARRVELLDELAPYAVTDPSHPWSQPDGHTRVPGGPSRWTGKKDLSWTPLRPELVVEVAYDQMEGDRFRHVARFVRWRPDRTATSCTFDQLERPVRYDLESLLSSVDRD